MYVVAIGDRVVVLQLIWDSIARWLFEVYPRLWTPEESAELVFVCNAAARRAIAWTGCLSGSCVISEQDSHGTRCWELGSDKSSRPSTGTVIGALALSWLRAPPLWTSRPLESEQ